MPATKRPGTHQFGKSSGIVLDIGIVGAGIAGLTAAAAATHANLYLSVPKVYERSRFANKLGAAVNVGPNAAPVLDAIGFDRKKARLVEVMEGKQFDGATLKVNYSGKYDDFASRFHAPWYFSHRVDLHNELKRLALEPPAGVTPATLHLSSPVASVDCEAGLLKFQDGTELQKDLIVGADGLHSVVARSVLGTDIPAGVVNECAYRFLIPTSKLLNNLVTKPLFQEDVATFHVATGSDRRLVWYPCRDNAEDLKLWQLAYRGPIRQWTSGKAILIGDAAHPMLPHQGQGANQAIEDAGALGVFLANVKDRNEVPRRLESVQNIRRDRAGAMQIFSNAGQDESHRIEKEVQPFIKGPVPKNQAEFHDWNFSYNILTDCQDNVARLY
ncbi:6-hydroxynicotinate 3-monooxygenase [Colletotrichum higginsianum]|uniref:6-hydroxynicotinate 3-monooxygenase n=1 Tax=Colletotrichum higginsianum TaxID=80884 RepID=A0A4T0VII9_9PEZI|nr:6-hydroxynicotinate 3-monooxygenase [Colletotrichum higginsianum]